MSIALPLLGVFLAALAVYFTSRERSDQAEIRSPDWLSIAAVGILLAVMLAFASRYGPELDRPWLAAGGLLGAIAATIPFGAPSLRASACVGLAAAILAHLVPAQGVPACQLALVAGAGLAAILTGGYAAALGATAVVALDRFGSMSGGSEHLSYAGSLVAIALLLSSVMQALLKKRQVEIVIAFVLPLLAFLFLGFWLKDQPLAATGALGVVGGAVLAALLSASVPVRPLDAGIGALISVGLATAAFALDRGTGMAAALLGALGFLLLRGNTRAILALGPLFALVLFRLFQNIYPETSRAFDIGQHYALIGLILGAILPLILVDSFAFAEQAKAKGVGALGLLALVAMGLSPILTVFLGPTGAVGFIVGLGFAGMFELVRQGTSLLALSAGTGMAGVMLVTYGWLSKSLDLTRNEKIWILGWSAGAMLLIALLSAFLLRAEPLKERK